MSFRAFVLMSLLLCRAATAAEPEVSQRILSGVAAIANDAIITIQEVETLGGDAIKSRLPLYRGNQERFREDYYRARNDAQEHLIERQLILDDFKSSGLVLPESFIDEQINDIIREKYGSRATLSKSLQAEGLNFAGFRQLRREDFILRAMETRNVREALIISPAKIEAYYRTNLAKYQLDDQVRLRGIVLKRDAINTSDEVLALAREIERKVNGSEDFAGMAATYSQGSQARDGGDWGWQETSKLSRGFADVAGGLAAGKHSGVLSRAPEGDKGYWIYFYDDAGRVARGRRYTVSEGKETFAEEKQFAGLSGHDGLPAAPVEFYLLKVEEKKTAHTKALNDLRDEIEKDLLVQERARLRAKWIDRLKTKAFVRRF